MLLYTHHKREQNGGCAERLDDPENHQTSQLDECEYVYTFQGHLEHICYNIRCRKKIKECTILLLVLTYKT